MNENIGVEGALPPPPEELIMEKTKKIKVALFTDVLKEDLDGVTHTNHNIISRIPKERFEFVFITALPPSKNIRLPFPVIPCRYIGMPMYKEYRLATPFFDKYLKKRLDEFQPDIIHFASPSLLGRYAIKYGLKKGLPVVSIYHTHFPTYAEYYFTKIPILLRIIKPFVHYVFRWYYNQCDIVYVPTSPVRDDLIEIGIDETRLKIWGRGIDTNRFNPNKRDNKYIERLCGKGSVRLLFVSRLVFIKEIKTLIGVYRQLYKKHPNVKMVITGDGPRKKYMEKKMPGAVFTGKLVGEDLSRIYASSDIFIFPSITETFGNVVLEAIASGLPVIVAAKGGPMGIVRDGVTGFHAEPKNADDFCKKISYLLDNPKLMKKMSRNALAYAKNQKWDTLCDEIFDSYKEIVSAKQK